MQPTRLQTTYYRIRSGVKKDNFMQEKTPDKPISRYRQFSQYGTAFAHIRRNDPENASGQEYIAGKSATETT